MRDKIKFNISKYLKCLSYAPKNGKTEGLLHAIPKGNLPFNITHIDHLGPFDKAPHRHKYIFLITELILVIIVNQSV